MNTLTKNVSAVTSAIKAVRNVRCAVSHSGNTTLHRVGKRSAYWQCSGCLGLYSADQIIAAKSGIHGSGGLRTVAE